MLLLDLLQLDRHAFRFVNINIILIYAQLPLAYGVLPAPDDAINDVFVVIR